MNIEKFLNRLKYGFYTVERFEARAERRVSYIEIGISIGTESNLLSIIGFENMLSLGAVPITAILITVLVSNIFILSMINRKNLTGELFEKYKPIFKKESFISKTLWSIFAYVLLVVSFAYFTVSVVLFFGS